MPFVICKKHMLPYVRFSRKIIWLELSTTNNDPGVVVKYYLDALFRLGGMCVICIAVVHN